MFAIKFEFVIFSFSNITTGGAQLLYCQIPSKIAIKTLMKIAMGRGKSHAILSMVPYLRNIVQERQLRAAFHKI